MGDQASEPDDRSGFDGVKPSKLLRNLRRLARRRGWEIDVSEGKRHTKVRLCGRRTQIGRHPTDLKTGTLRAILDQLGITREDLED